MTGIKDLFISQLCWLVHENRFATFEWMADNYMWALDSDRIGREYSIVHNTSQQILDVNSEMLQRLGGTWHDTDEDLELQSRLRSVQMFLVKGLRRGWGLSFCENISTFCHNE